MSNSLIIDARRKTKIKIDGPSLIVQAKGKAIRRFPIRVIRKIIVIGTKLKGLHAVTECAALQIGVFFMSSNGELRSQTLGMYSCNVNWNDWLDQCLWHKDWKYDYSDTVENFRKCLTSEFKIFNHEMIRNKKLCYESMAGHLNSRWGKKRSRNSKQWLIGFIEIMVAKTMFEMSIPTSHSFGRRILVDAQKLLLMRALMDCCANKKIQPLDGPEEIGKFYQKFSDDWRSILVRLFLLLEHMFDEKETNTGLNNIV